MSSPPRAGARSGWLVGAAVACLLASLASSAISCASAPAAPLTPAPAIDEHVADDDPFDAAALTVPAPEQSRPPSTASYDEALSKPESLDVNDDHAHLTDGQLTGPIRGVLEGCRVPSTAKVTIRTAVQNGRAIGVTTLVVFEHPRSMKRVSTAAAKYEAKTKARIIMCADRAVRAVTWPPSRRRDSFTTMF